MRKRIALFCVLLLALTSIVSARGFFSRRPAIQIYRQTTATASEVAPTGDAVAADVLSGKTFSNAIGIDIAGAMPNIGAQNITPGTELQPISEGYHDGTGAVAGDANLTPGNIATGVVVFGVEGVLDVGGIDTGDATAGVGDILDGETAYVNGAKITGTIPTQTLSNATTTVAAGYYAATALSVVDSDLVAENVKKNVNLFGVTGSCEATGDPGGEEWTPASMTLSHWFDANDTTAITKDGSNLVSQWNDKSGNARHATQATDTNKPLHYYDEVIGKWVVRFNGSDNGMGFDGSALVASSYTIFAAIRRNSNKDYSNYIGGLDYSTPYTGKQLSMGYYEADKYIVGHFGVSSQSDWYKPFVIDPKVLTCRVLGDNSSSFYINGYLGHYATDTVTIAKLVSYNNAQLGHSMSNSSLHRWFDGDILEIIMTTDAMSDENRLLVEGYLAHKWGISLPSHAYSEYSPRIQ